MMKKAGALAFLAAAVSATPSPAQIDARATGSSTGSSTLPTITTKGNAFWDGSTRFYIRGIDYQPGGSSGTAGSDGATDPLADPSTCQRDIKYFKELGLNTIRVYTVDNSANHDQCMNALAEAGIYLVLDVNTPKYSLNRIDVEASYNPTYLQSVFATIDAFAQYSNTLAFFSGNEVINALNTTNTAPYIKAVTRDMKQYIGERGYRAIPVGYSAADVPNQFQQGQYMNCGPAPMRSDFFAMNNYQWCDPSSFTKSGLDVFVQQYSKYSIPLFFSEYGCITNTRTFAETKALYQTDMTKAVSGGLVYQYSEEGDGSGIVNINGNTVNIIPQQFNDLKQELTSTPDPSGDGGYSANNPPSNCPSQSHEWDISPFSGSALPAQPSGISKYFQNGAGKGPGLSGPGSQNAGGASSGTASAGVGSVTATYGNGSPTGNSAPGALHSINSISLMPFVASAVAVLFSFGFGAYLL